VRSRLRPVLREPVCSGTTARPFETDPHVLPSVGTGCVAALVTGEACATCKRDLASMINDLRWVRLLNRPSVYQRSRLNQAAWHLPRSRVSRSSSPMFPEQGEC
jgi:hypothetical protein